MDFGKPSLRERKKKGGGRDKSRFSSLFTKFDLEGDIRSEKGK